MAYDQQLDREDPNLLWHYTGFAAFLSIMKSGTIWLSETTFLNDREEMTFGLAVAKQEVVRLLQEKGLREGTKDESGVNLADRFVEESKVVFGEMEQAGTFVVSFSQHGDLLSQWRAYCPSGGVAIGFDRETLRKCFTELGGQTDQKTPRIAAALRPCVYRRPLKYGVEGPGALDDHLMERLAALTQNWGLKSIDVVRSDFLRICVLFKHQGFSEEGEWRGVYAPKIPHTEHAIQVRAMTGRLVRYVEAGWKGSPSWDPDRHICALRRVRLGPVEPHERTAMLDAIRRAASSAAAEFNPEHVDASDTPFRRG